MENPLLLLNSISSGVIVPRRCPRHALVLILDVEVSQVLRRYWRKGQLPEERGREALADLEDFPLERYSHSALLSRIWQLRGDLTAYDAAYVALAEALDAPLITCDKRLAWSIRSRLERHDESRRRQKGEVHGGGCRDVAASPDPWFGFS